MEIQEEIDRILKRYPAPASAPAVYNTPPPASMQPPPIPQGLSQEDLAGTNMNAASPQYPEPDQRQMYGEGRRAMEDYTVGNTPVRDPRMADYEQQSDVITNVLNEKDPAKRSQIFQTVLNDRDVHPTFRKIVQQAAATDFLDDQSKQDAKSFVQNADPYELNKMVNTKDEGKNDKFWNYVRGSYYASLGLNSLAEYEFKKGNNVRTYSSQMTQDGRLYTVEKDPDGQIVKAWGADGQQISGREFGAVSAGGIDQTKANQFAPQTGYDNAGNFVSGRWIGNRYLWRNEATGERLPTAPVGFRPTPVDPVSLRKISAYNSSKARDVAYNNKLRLQGVDPSKILTDGQIEQRAQAASAAVGEIGHEGLPFTTGSPPNVDQRPDQFGSPPQQPIQQGQPLQQGKPPQQPDAIGPILDQEATAIASYQTRPVNPTSVLNKAVMQRVMSLNPSYSPRDFDAVDKTLTAFTTGPVANQIQSINTVFPHMNHLAEIQLGLKTGNLQLVNKWANEFGLKTGAAPQAVFEAAKNAVTDEIAKAVLGANSAVSDRKAFGTTLSSDLSPQQFSAVVRNYKDQILDRALTLKQQFKSGYGPAYAKAKGEDKFDSFFKPEVLTAITVKEAKAELARRNKGEK